eukprot:6174258-Pleurochrysis_carterae.AAC.1
MELCKLIYRIPYNRRSKSSAVRYGRRLSGPGGKRLIIHDATKSGRGAGAGAGAERTCGVAAEWWRSQAVSPMRATVPITWIAEFERSASTHATQVQNGILCMRATRNGALRQFQTEYSRRGQKAKESAGSR